MAIIILVLIIILGGGYLLYVRYGKGTSTATSSPTPAATVSAVTSATPTASSSISANAQELVCKGVYPDYTFTSDESKVKTTGTYCSVREVQGSFAVGDTRNVVEFNQGNPAGPGAMFIAAKVNDKWVLVQSSQDSFSCDKLRQYNVPKTLLSNDGTCVNSAGKNEAY